VPWQLPALKPEPIPVKLKIVMIGDARLYYALDAFDTGFADYFKVLADFSTTIERTPTGIGFYAGVLAGLAMREKLPAFDRTAVAALVEHGSRIAAQEDKLTARFGRLADLAREAAYLCRRDERDVVTAGDVNEAVRRTKRRADLPARRFTEMITKGVIRVNTSGEQVGEVNGLAVMHAGPLTYGFPARITATIGAGSAGAINIEREANLSGAIHTKGFYILSGLLRYLLRTPHPLTFSASIAFEQSYGGIDGDSASGAEMCCLLSALTDVPLRQDLAMTGAIDQVGHILPIGGVNEKIEGFYDVCAAAGLTGTQGVIIPKTNVGDLMLRQDVVDACADGKFQVYAVDTIQEALALFTGRAVEVLDDEGYYEDDCLLGQAVEQAGAYWRMVAGANQPQIVIAGDEDEGTEAAPAPEA
jgi:ATP-dependent Lon protease